MKDAQTAVEALIAAAEPLKPEAALPLAIATTVGLVLAITITIAMITTVARECDYFQYCFALGTRGPRLH